MVWSIRRTSTKINSTRQTPLLDAPHLFSLVSDVSVRIEAAFEQLVRLLTIGFMIGPLCSSHEWLVLSSAFGL